MEFQTNLKKLRTENGLTQDQLALLVETSTDTIGRIERKQKIASYEVLFSSGMSERTKEKADAVMDVISSAGTSLTFILRPFRRFEAPFRV